MKTKNIASIYICTALWEIPILAGGQNYFATIIAINRYKVFSRLPLSGRKGGEPPRTGLTKTGNAANKNATSHRS